MEKPRRKDSKITKKLDKQKAGTRTTNLWKEGENHQKE